MRPQSVALEHHAGVAAIRRQVRHVLVIESNTTGRGLDEARKHPQQRGLPASRWAQKKEQIPGFDLEIDSVDCGRLAEPLGDSLDADARHIHMTIARGERDRIIRPVQR